jgi:hypothetical protein
MAKDPISKSDRYFASTSVCPFYISAAAQTHFELLHVGQGFSLAENNHEGLPYKT